MVTLIMLSQLNSLYSGESGQVSVNAMNAPNNSTLQVHSTSLCYVTLFSGY